MEQFNDQPTDLHTHEEAKLPTVLNVLTILTYIGAALSLIGAIMIPLGCKVTNSMDMGDAMTEQQMEAMRLTCENSTILMISAILGAILSIVAATMMRKLKLQGYYIYLAAQIVPLIISGIVMSSLMFKDKSSLIGYGFSALFIGLYTWQRKYLVK